MPQGEAIKKGFLFFSFFMVASFIFSQRVVSMAPAITEIVFALGKGDRLVGVTKFCDYPPLAQKIAKVGGFLDVNMEILLALAPKIVIAYPEQYSQVKFLEARAQVLVVKHQCLADLWNSIFAIGRALQADVRAKAMVAAIQKKLAAITNRVGKRKKASTLIIAGRNADELKNMYIIGNNDFLNDLLEIAGGVNAYRGAVNYPNISMETVILLNPDFIFEISAHYERIAAEKVFRLWRPFKMLLAVRKGQIKIIEQSFWLRPGPRVGLIAEELARFFSAADNLKKPVSAD
jgi:iron complex transport system substrate-binding protein